MPHRLPFAAIAAIAAASLALLCCFSATAGSWDASAPGGLQWRIVEDATRTRDGYLLERRYPDGRLDAQFGNGGTVMFALGPDNEGPAALRVDAAGRAWIVGGSQAADGLRAVVLRFTANGLPDSLFALGGRAAVAPAGAQARALDVLPLDDGSAWVAGTIIDVTGQERSGAWRLHPDGSVDTRFGLGGLWQDDAAGATEVGSLQRAPDGSLALGLRRRADGRSWLETFTWTSRATTPRAESRTGVDEAAMDRAKMVWHDGRWQWIDAAGLAIAGFAAPRDVGRAATAANATGTQIVASAAGAASASVSFASAPSVDRAGGQAEGRWGTWLLLAALALPAAWFVLRRR